MSKRMSYLDKYAIYPEFAPTCQRRALPQSRIEIIIARSRRAPQCHHRLRSSQPTVDKFVVQNPKRGEGARCHAAFLGVLFTRRAKTNDPCETRFEEFADRRNRRAFLPLSRPRFRLPVRTPLAKGEYGTPIP